MKRISMTYGQVLFELGMKKESLQKAQDMLHENKELLRALENPMITKKEKENVVDKLFSDDLRSSLKIVCDNAKRRTVRENQTVSYETVSGR